VAVSEAADWVSFANPALDLSATEFGGAALRQKPLPLCLTLNAGAVVSAQQNLRRRTTSAARFPRRHIDAEDRRVNSECGVLDVLR
jgi:hypothetical protein